MFDLPESDRDQFHSWTFARAESLQRMTSDVSLSATNEALVDSEAYLLRLIALRRRRLGDDLLSRLILAEVDGDRLSGKEIAANVNQLFSAGLDTVKYLIANGLALLLRYPEQARILCRSPQLAGNAVEEVLRLEGGMTVAPAREVVSAVPLGDQTLPAGAIVLPILLAANRDPARFAEPDEFRVARPDPRPLTFGGGIHRCLGAALARVQAQEVFLGFVQQLQRAVADWDSVVWSDDIGRRGPDRLTISIRGADQLG